MKILVIDVGGTHVKMLGSDDVVRRRFVSGPTLTPIELVEGVQRLTHGAMYDAISIGYPGLLPSFKGRPDFPE